MYINETTHVATHVATQVATHVAIRDLRSEGPLHAACCSPQKPDPAASTFRFSLTCKLQRMQTRSGSQCARDTAQGTSHSRVAPFRLDARALVGVVSMKSSRADRSMSTWVYNVCIFAQC
jgi:hypothetical protein